MKKLFAIALVAAMLSACGPSPSYQMPVDPNTPVPTQPAQQGVSNGTAILGAAAAGLGGYMLGKSSRPSYQPPVVVHHYHYVTPRSYVQRSYSRRSYRR